MNHRRLRPILAAWLVAASSSGVSAAAGLEFGCSSPAIAQVVQQFAEAHPGVKVAARDVQSRNTGGCSGSTLPTDIFYGSLATDQAGDGAAATYARVEVFDDPDTHRLEVSRLHFAQRPVADLSAVGRGVSALSRALRRVPPNLTRLAGTKGRVWALPYAVQMEVYAVRPDVFAAAGLALGDDWEWPAFFIDAKKTQAVLLANRDGRSGAGSIGAALPTLYDEAGWHAFFLGNSDTLFDDQGHAAFASPANLETLATLQGWLRSGAVDLINVQRGLRFQAAAPVRSAQLLADDLRAALGGFTQDAYANPVATRLPIKMMPFPHAPGRDGAPVPLALWSLMISSATPSPLLEPASELLAYLPQHSDAVYASSGLLPPDPAAGRRVFGQGVAAYYRLMASARLYPTGSGNAGAGAWQRFRDHFAAFAQGSITPARFAELVDG